MIEPGHDRSYLGTRTRSLPTPGSHAALLEGSGFLPSTLPGAEATLQVLVVRIPISPDVCQ